MGPTTFVRTLIVACLCLGAGGQTRSAHSQGAPLGVVSGSVVDPTGALVAGAELHLKLADDAQSPAHVPLKELHTDLHGAFRLELLPGRYILQVEAPGFASYSSRVLSVTANEGVHLSVHLPLATLQQEVSVLQDRTEATDPDSVASALVFEGHDLDFLSSDSGTLRQQLAALAGGSPHFLVDGFSGGKLPPKASIRAIRISQNAFSAYFSEYGAGRVEVDTKPGSDKLHGRASFSGTNQPLNARNPYSPVAPPFYEFQSEGNVDGPLSRNTSFFVSEDIDQLANNAVVNATDPAQPDLQISTSTPNPQLTQTYSLRLDHQFSPRHFAYLRDEWSQAHVLNSGIRPLILPEAAFTSNTLTETLQLADTQVLGPHGVNEARFQYLRTRLAQSPNSSVPSVIVQGAFQRGGNPGQSSQDNQDAYEVQDRLEFDRGLHSIRTGFRFRSVRDANRSNAGFNGQYIFPDVSSYQAGRASQYSQTVGQQSSVLLNSDLGVYAEDDWKATSHLTLSYGVRFESQTALPDATDLAPRIGFAWALGTKQNKAPLLTLRGGFGLFYERFPLPQLLQTVRQNGKLQVAYLTQDVAFNPAGPPSGAVLDASQPTLYQVSPRYRSPYSQVGTLSVLRSMKRFGTVSGNFVYIHEVHGLLSRNLNAPLPGTVNPDIPGSGVFPLGNTNLYQFSSDANGNLERFYVNYRVALGTRVFAFGVIKADKHRSETEDITSFPVNQYNLRLDYARDTTDTARAFTGGFRFQLPFGVEANTFIAAHSGTPFNVTTGTDLNADTIYNDRPAIGTQAQLSSAVRTQYGVFDVQPSANATLLGRNAFVSAAYAWVQLQASRDFHLGPRSQVVAPASGGQAAVSQDRPWVLNVGVEIHNLTNRNNPGVPVGAIAAQACGSAGTVPCSCTTPGDAGCVLSPSRLFGQPLSLAEAFSPITASNRTILLQTSFTW